MEHRSFLHLVLIVNWGFGRECKHFCAKLSKTLVTSGKKKRTFCRSCGLGIYQTYQTMKVLGINLVPKMCRGRGCLGIKHQRNYDKVFIWVYQNQWTFIRDGYINIHKCKLEYTLTGSIDAGRSEAGCKHS